MAALGAQHPWDRAATPGSDAMRAAWAALEAARSAGWYVGRPSYHPERREWLMHAFDPAEPAIDGARSREWTAVARTELGVVREMARCLQELRVGRVPR